MTPTQEKLEPCPRKSLEDGLNGAIIAFTKVYPKVVDEVITSLAFDGFEIVPIARHPSAREGELERLLAQIIEIKPQFFSNNDDPWQSYKDGWNNHLKGRSGPNMYDPESQDFANFELGWCEHKELEATLKGPTP